MPGGAVPSLRDSDDAGASPGAGLVAAILSDESAYRWNPVAQKFRMITPPTSHVNLCTLPSSGSRSQAAPILPRDLEDCVFRDDLRTRVQRRYEQEQQARQRQREQEQEESWIHIVLPLLMLLLAIHYSSTSGIQPNPHASS